MAIPTVPKMILDGLDPHRPKILLILQDPVDRLDSAYQMHLRPYISAIMEKEKSQFNESTGRFHDVGIMDLPLPSMIKYIDDEILEYHARGLLEDFPLLSSFYNSTTDTDENNTSNSGNEQVTVWAPPSPSPSQVAAVDLLHYTQAVARGFYAKQLKFFLKYFPLGTHLKVIRYETFLENKAKVLDEILQFVGSAHAPFPWQDEDMDKYLGPHKEELDPKTVEAIKMANQTRMYLKALYRPFNDELAALLGDEWKDVWK